MENQIFFSESFIDFLHKISYESKIARLIISCRRARSDGFHYLYKAVLKMDEVNYITYRNNGLISYMPADRVQEYNEDSTWKREGRQEGKPARVMRRLFTPNALKCIKDSDFEIFNNKYKSQFSTNDFMFEIRPAEDIPDVYCMDRMNGGASLNGSCMNDDRRYLDIYKNCSSLQILILKNEIGRLAGRCLLWTIQHEGATIILADRFYVAEDHLYDAFVAYVESNKWWRKKYYKTYDYKRHFISPDGEEFCLHLKVETDTDFSHYPYIDTFQYGDDGYLTNDDDDATYTYNQTNGDREGGEPEGVYDEIDEGYIEDDDAVCIERGTYRGQNTHVDNAVQVGDYWWWREDDGITCLDGKYYLADDVVYSEYDNESYLLEDCVYSEHHGTFIHIEDAYEVDGDYYHEDIVKKL